LSLKPDLGPKEHAMDRRQFVEGVAATAAAVGFRPAEGSTAGHRRAERIVVDGLDTSLINEGFLDLLEAGGVDCVHKSQGEPLYWAMIYAFLAHHRDRIVPAFSVKEIRDAKSQGKRSIIFGMQHANQLEAMIPKDTNGFYAQLVAGLELYHGLGLRLQGICYNVTNMFGGGCLDPRVPLTRAGRRLVEEVHKLRIVLDVAGHTGEQTSLDALEVSSGVPVVCTHTNAAALNANPRATTDRVLEAIAKTGGVVGITAISDFQIRNPGNYRSQGSRSPQVTLDQHLNQYDYMKKLIGIELIALGPDFVWGWGEQFNHKAEDSATFPPDALSDGPAVTTQGYENISKLPSLVAGLRGRGWSETELDQLLGGNWLRVYERVWGA
jgi:membrane dipeptidase